MPVLNIICPICTEVFENADDIYSTSCGHVFHFSCMSDWQCRETSCPQCRFCQPTTHKLYLSFDDTDESPNAIEELKIQLKSSVDKIQELYDEIQEGKTNFANLLEDFIQSEELTGKLKKNIRQFEVTESNFLHLQAQYTELEDRNRELRETVQVLTIENEFKQKEINSNLIEIDTLKTNHENCEWRKSEMLLKETFHILDKKCQHLSAELEKEISNNTQLSHGKMKLNSYIDQIKSKENISKSVKIENKNSIQNQNPTLENVQNLTVDFIPNVSDNTSVVIRNYPSNKITYPLENIVIALASTMNFIILQEDLVNVSIMEKRIQLPKKVTLVVQFRSTNIKAKFLSNKNKLKKKPTYKYFAIREHVDEITNSVFQYANKKLRGNGFGYIFLENNRVIVKRNHTDSKSIHITSKAHVDELIREIENNVF